MDHPGGSFTTIGYMTLRPLLRHVSSNAIYPLAKLSSELFEEHKESL